MKTVPALLFLILLGTYSAMAFASEEADVILPENISALEADSQEGMAPFDSTDASSTELPELNQVFDVHASASCSVPTITVASSKCCSYGIKDNAANKSVMYRQPLHSFGSEAAARTFAATVKASMPLYQPFDEQVAYLGHGWFYNNGGFHAGFDIIKKTVNDGQDPTFPVKATAQGKVVTVLWDDWLGNTVVIEHTAPNGSKYRSLYMHLRDGFNHDLTKARAIPAQGTAGDNWDKYRKFAALSNPNALHWGTESQKIKVKVGDLVQAEQQIAWSGNTGAGGAGNGLNNDGTAGNPKTANNHLHFMMTVPDPKNPGDWVFVDPYGSYGKSSDGCYDLMANLGYNRLFAPFYSNFHNLRADVFSKFLNYYPGMGMGLQTLSENQVGGNSIVAGAFDSAAPGQWYVRYGLDSAAFNQWFATYHNQGYRPRQISVLPGPRFTTIWQKRNGEAYYTYINMTDAQFNEHWNDLVKAKGYRVDDYAEYMVGGTHLHAAIFVKDQQSSAFYLYYGLDFNAFQNMFDKMRTQGFNPSGVSGWDFGSTDKFAGVWRNLPGSWLTHHAMTSAQYQTFAVQALNQGYKLQKITSYSDKNMYNAVWLKK